MSYLFIYRYCLFWWLKIKNIITLTFKIKISRKNKWRKQSFFLKGPDKISRREMSNSIVLIKTRLDINRNSRNASVLLSFFLNRLLETFLQFVLRRSCFVQHHSSHFSNPVFPLPIRHILVCGCVCMCTRAYLYVAYMCATFICGACFCICLLCTYTWLTDISM